MKNSESRKVCGLSGSLFSQGKVATANCIAPQQPFPAKKVVQNCPRAVLNHKYTITILSLNYGQSERGGHSKSFSVLYRQQLTCGRAGWETAACRSAGTVLRPAGL